MSEITEQLHKEIETLDLGQRYKERICMWAVSKDLKGEFAVAEQEEQKCRRPGCMTLKARVRFKVQVTPHGPCDARASRAFDGTIEGELLFAHIDSGEGRGYHLGRFEWAGADSALIGRMSGVTNAGTHRSPAAPCEPCDQRGHMEGRLDAIVVDGKYQRCRVLATYVINYDTSYKAQDTAIIGTLEGVLICPCEG
jgi:hypothetical protein